ncbi:SulP family inorganic anion transporter [Thiohalophilus sp.]|uniref:SulP family inorganic anion transporter n=1 Tax=Thiohalophilus sp. TaxID=3028392 RepID=UPI002ACEE72C|nr:SulP family inorganic anion transporter [Thiohalophilus sp.]MDZ7661911.1 SulP family inorganic anion transporter [Thiohalophilus sp.]MDZ7803778.1 SulP family inorganic anion transporter [Thiohalophilus sp.]
MSTLFDKLFPFLLWWPMVGRHTLRADLIAGLTGAVIVLPQSVAFATIAGLPPQYGLYTAMVTPIVAALFGSSRHLISGPTTAISIVVFSTLSGHAEPGSTEFIQLALTLTFLAGVYQFAFGLARLGTLVNFVSHTVVIGFTAGAAVLIATSQMKHITSIHVPAGESFVHVWMDLFSHLEQLDPLVFGVAAFTLIVAVLIKRFLPSLPNLLLAMIAGSLLALELGGEAAGLAMIGEIPGHLPPLSSPDFSFAAIRELAPQAFAVALLGLIEAVSISRAIAAKSHQQIDGNQEFIGQGLSNMVGSFFSSYAGSGSFTRSGINYAAGAYTPMSAIFAAIILMAIVLLIAPLMAYLPIATMGGIILLVAYNLVDFHHIKKILQVSRSETAILLVTFFATLFLHLEFAIYLGVILSLVIFLSRTSTPEVITLAPDPATPKHSLTNVEKKPLAQCPQLKIIRIDMSIYFGSLTNIQRLLNHISDEEGINHILIISTGINFIDMAGAEMLVQEAQRLKQRGGGLYFTDNKSRVCRFLRKGHFIEAIGEDHFFASKQDAIRHIFDNLNKSTCTRCDKRIFKECETVPEAGPVSSLHPEPKEG